MTKTDRLREIGRLALEPDAADLRGMSVKEAMLGLGLGVFVVFIGSFHLALSVWQVVVSFLLVGYDLITRILKKVIPGPDLAANSK